MAEHNESSSEDDEEYGDRSRGLEFIFGNVDNSGGLDADYLNEDAKEHLSALASSLPDIMLLASSDCTTSDPAEQDYNEKAVDAVDYGDIDEEYDGPEVQVVTEEDHLLPKREYLSSAAASGSLYSKDSVFDDDDYDEEEEHELERMPFEESFDSEDSESVVLKEDKALEYEEEATILGNEKRLDTNEKNVTSLPTLYVEDGTVVLQFSEIFAIHKPPQKRGKRENRYITYRDRYKSMELVEDDEGLLLKSHGRIDNHVKQADLSQLDVPPLPTRGDLQLVKAGTFGSIIPESREFTKLGRDSCTMGELLKQDLEDDKSCQSQSSMEVFPLDQHEWENRIIWENSPEVSGNSCESVESGIESESLLLQGTNSAIEQESFNVVNSREQAQAKNNKLVSFFVTPLESLGSRGSHTTSESTDKSRRHPHLLRLESQWDDDHLSEIDDAGGKNLKQIKSDALGRFSRLGLQERDMGDDAWLDSIIWESAKELSRSKLIFDLQDEKMVFEIPGNRESKDLQLHAGSMILSRSSKPKDERFQEGCGSNYGWQFNISNDKFYMNGKSCQQLQANANQFGVHSLRVLHSASAIKLQTMKNKLSNKDIANFHRPKALWYPHDNELAIKQQGKLLSQGSMQIVVKSLGGKGSKIHVGIEESVSYLKAKASRKLDFKETEAVKIFHMGKELEDEKSLAEQNVHPNSLVHILRTKVHLLPWAQRLPGEHKSLRPPGAFKKKSDLSTKDGHVFLMEYCEERPLMLSNAGMGANLCTYYQKSFPEDQHGNLLRDKNDTLGNVMILEPGEKSPFLGEIQGGCSQSSIETNMYKAPVFPHRLQSTDYLLVRSPKGKLSLRRIDKIFAVGQQEPRMEVMSPASKNLQTYLVNRMLVYVDREFKHRHRIPADELSFLFSNLSDAVVKKNMRLHGIFLERDKNGQIFWYNKHRFDKIPPEIELKNLVAPEDVCSYESMLAGLYRLKHLGITKFTLPASISTALAQLPDEAISLAAASHIERELQITPWNLSSNFVACTTQDRANIERLEITGVGDPSGRGLGFSYVRAAPKVPAAAGRMKKKEAACCGAPTVTGTDADLRRLSREAAREVLLKFNVPDEKMAKQNRWHLIAMIRKLSSEQAASGVLKRMSFLQLQQQAREKCQEIWDRQLLSLSSCDDDESESENDMDSFVGDLENLLDAEVCEESNTSKNDKLDGVKGLKMRRRPYQVVTDEEVEDEAAEYAELRRLLMKDEEKKNMNAQFVRKDSVSAKKHIATQHDASFLVSGSTFKDTTNFSVFKERKPVRDNFFCGACGQRGHMKTNKHCPKYRATTESHAEGIYVKKSSGTLSSSNLSGQVKLELIKNKKTAPKSPIKFSVDEAPKGDNSTSKTGGLTLRFKCAIPAGGMLDKPGSETPRRSMGEPDRPLPSLMPELMTERAESESHKPSVSGQSFSNTERNQPASSRLTISITQPSLRMDKELVIQRPKEREQPQKKLVIKRSKVITDHEMSSLEMSSQFDSRKTMRMAEPVDFQRQQRFRLSENSLDREISTERQREARVRRDYYDMTGFEKANEREEKERRKKVQPEVIERYVEDYPRRRNDKRLLERVQKVRSQYVSDFERNVAEEYAPQPKRRKKGEVGLANILEVIVDTLRAKEVNVSYLFLKPVSKKEAPNYLDVVERPMDLSTIRDKVRRIEYRDREQFRNDVWQIKYNAHLYNDVRNPTIPPLADELLVKCDGLLDRYRDELTEAEKGIVISID
ncbi:hypothetical protein Bca52824_020721 [Brassica carinata]|uniref:Transcription initiation factor TFIID subunit 1 n=1 Tax=Brassica carinata TaxID=52824 RepID=A0A8X7VU69_BRACI|nr:hypothetical protein Bca52824_020721 [Brassica carinata]